MTAAGIVFGVAAAGIWLPSRIDRIRTRRRALLQAQVDEERELGEAMRLANVTAYERLGRSANR